MALSIAHSTRKAMNTVFAPANESFAAQNVLFDDLEFTGKRIKSIREQLGLGIREWAADAGIGVASQHDIEQGACGNRQLVLFSWNVVPRMLVRSQKTINAVMEAYFDVARRA